MIKKLVMLAVACISSAGLSDEIGGPVMPPEGENATWCYVDATISCVDAVANAIIEWDGVPYATLHCGCTSIDGGLNWTCADANKVWAAAQENITLHFARQHATAGNNGPSTGGKKSVTDGANVDCGSRKVCKAGNCFTIIVQGQLFRSCAHDDFPQDGDTLPMRERFSAGEHCNGVLNPRIGMPSIEVINTEN